MFSPESGDPEWGRLPGLLTSFVTISNYLEAINLVFCPGDLILYRCFRVESETHPKGDRPIAQVIPDS
jgi:hypothetical protein